MSDDSELLAALMAAALAPADGADLWPAFLDRLARLTQADSAWLLLAPQGAPERLWQAGAPWAGPAEAAGRMRAGRVYSQVDLPGSAPPPRPLRALRLPLAAGGAVTLALGRGGADFRALDGVRLSGLVPHLGPAMDGWLRLMHQQDRARIDRQMLADLGGGWMLLTPSGQVAELSPGLAARLEALAGIQLRADGWLACPDPGAMPALRQAVAAAQVPGAGPQWLALSQGPAVQMVVTSGPAGLVGRLRHALSARALPVGRLAGLLGISRSEARLAARLCDGQSLAEAAQDLGWTMETARSCSKRIFARTGSRGQPDLLRRMLESAIWLDQG